MGLSDKITAGTSVANHKVSQMDDKFQVSEKTKSAFSAAEQTGTSAGSAVINNRYVLTGVSWVVGRVTKAAGEAGQKTKDKLSTASANPSQQNA